MIDSEYISDLDYALKRRQIIYQQLIHPQKEYRTQQFSSQRNGNVAGFG